MPRPLASPEKELRFTRAGQAPVFWIAAAVLASTAVTLFACSFYRDINPALPQPLWAALPLALAWLCLRVAIRLTRHAYIILTPVGIEILPFFRPARSMSIVAWQEIDSAETDAADSRLTLHFNAGKTSGIHLTLRPICRVSRPLLIRAVLARCENRSPAQNSAASLDGSV